MCDLPVLAWGVTFQESVLNFFYLILISTAEQLKEEVMVDAAIDVITDFFLHAENVGEDVNDDPPERAEGQSSEDYGLCCNNLWLLRCLHNASSLQIKTIGDLIPRQMFPILICSQEVLMLLIGTTYFIDKNVCVEGIATVMYEDIEWFLLQPPEYMANLLAVRIAYKSIWLDSQQEKMLKVGRYYYVLKRGVDLFMFPVDFLFYNAVFHKLEHSSLSMARESANILMTNSSIFTNPLAYVKIKLLLSLEMSMNFNESHTSASHRGLHFAAFGDECEFNNHADQLRVVVVHNEDIGQ